MGTSGSRHAGIAVVALALALSACADGAADSTEPDPTTTTGNPTTTGPQATTTTTLQSEGQSPCSDSTGGVSLDLDGIAPDERVVLRDLADGTSEIAVCDGSMLITRGIIVGSATAILGVVDVDDVAPLEILIAAETERGPAVRLARSTLRGLDVTGIVAERWIDPPYQPDTFFDGESFECDDVDDDGLPELATIAYRSADVGEYGNGETLINLRIGFAVANGDEIVHAGLDQFETPAAEAYARWSREPRCAPGAAPYVEVKWGSGGWGVLDASGAFQSAGDLLMTGMAYDAKAGRFVAVGIEAPSFLLGEFFEPRPVIWWSDDRLTWVRADLGDATGGLRDVTALVDGGFVAVGSRSRAPAVWLSMDGVEWEPIDVPAGSDGGSGEFGHAISGVVAAPAGLVAVGLETYVPTEAAPGEDLDAAVWVSVDGREWERIHDRDLGTAGFQLNRDGEFNAELTDVAHVPGLGFAAVGSASPSDPAVDYPIQTPAVWVSADGVEWERRSIGVDGRLRGVVGGGTGFAIFGVTDLHGSPTADGLVATSPDGFTWTREEGPFGDIAGHTGIQTMNAGIFVPRVGAFVVGSDEAEFETRGAAAVWVSGVDMESWERVPLDPRVFGATDASPTFTMTGAAWDGTTLVVSGFTGRMMELPGGVGSGCCIYEPSVWLWDPARAEG